MKRTVSANISGQFFHIDDDAYEKLSHYLDIIRNSFKTEDGGDEIMSDIEGRIAEMLKEKVNDRKVVVNLEDVDAVIAVMGKPEDYFGDQGAPAGSFHGEKVKRIYRNPDDRILGGVCGGLGAYFQIDPLWLRIMLLLLLFIFGFGPLIYIILWIIIPEAKTPSEKLAMRGEPINIDNISRTFRNEMENVGDRIKKGTEGLGKKENAGRIRESVNDMVDATGTLIGMFFKVLVKIIGVFFIAFSLLLLICFVSLLFVKGFSLGINDRVNVLSLDQVLGYILPAGTNQVLVYVTIILVVMVPLIALLWAGLKMLFNIRGRGKVLGSVLGISWLVGLGFALYLGAVTVRDFSQYSSNREVIPVPYASDTLMVSLSPEYSPDWENAIADEDGDISLGFTNDSLYIGYVKMDVLRSDDSTFKLEMITSSRGKTRTEAQKKASRIIYPLEVSGNGVVLSEGFYTAWTDRFRDQKVNLKLFVPQGKSVFLSSGTEKILYDVANVQDMHDERMSGKLWTMTEHGLDCMQCPARRSDAF